MTTTQDLHVLLLFRPHLDQVIGLTEEGFPNAQEGPSPPSSNLQHQCENPSPLEQGEVGKDQQGACSQVHLMTGSQCF